MELGLPPQWTVNTCAMGHCLITLYEATGDEKYWDVVMSKVHYLQEEEALRFGDHVLQHTVSANNDFRNRPGRTLCSWRLFPASRGREA